MMNTEPGTGRTIRYDPGPPGAVDPRLTPHSIRRLFQTWISAATRDRRQMPRHEAQRLGSWLGWWRGEHSFFAVLAALDNISRGGALLTVAAPPRDGQSVWICLDGADEPADACLAATVLDVARVAPERFRVRIEFAAPCPTGFLEAAVCGLAPPGPRADPDPSGRSHDDPLLNT